MCFGLQSYNNDTTIRWWHKVEITTKYVNRTEQQTTIQYAAANTIYNILNHEIILQRAYR